MKISWTCHMKNLQKNKILSFCLLLIFLLHSQPFLFGALAAVEKRKIYFHKIIRCGKYVKDNITICRSKNNLSNSSHHLENGLGNGSSRSREIEFVCDIIEIWLWWAFFHIHHVVENIRNEDFLLIVWKLICLFEH